MPSEGRCGNPPLACRRPGGHAADHQGQPSQEEGRNVARATPSEARKAQSAIAPSASRVALNAAPAGRLSARTATPARCRRRSAPRGPGWCRALASAKTSRTEARRGRGARGPPSPGRRRTRAGAARSPSIAGETALENLGRRLRQVRLQQRRQLLDRGIGLAQARDGERRAAGWRSSSFRPAAGRRRRRRAAWPAARPGAAARARRAEQGLRIERPGQPGDVEQAGHRGAVAGSARPPCRSPRRS